MEEGPPGCTSSVFRNGPSKEPEDACQEAMWSSGAAPFSRKTEALVRCRVKNVVAMAARVPLLSSNKGQAGEPVMPSGLLSGQLATWQKQGSQCSLFHGCSGHAASWYAALQQFFAFRWLKVFIDTARIGELGA